MLEPIFWYLPHLNPLHSNNFCVSFHCLSVWSLVYLFIFAFHICVFFEFQDNACLMMLLPGYLVHALSITIIISWLYPLLDLFLLIHSCFIVLNSVNHSYLEDSSRTCSTFSLTSSGPTILLCYVKVAAYVFYAFTCNINCSIQCCVWFRNVFVCYVLLVLKFTSTFSVSFASQEYVKGARINEKDNCVFLTMTFFSSSVCWSSHYQMNRKIHILVLKIYN